MADEATRRGSRSLRKSGLCAGGLRWVGIISSCKAAGQPVREEWLRPSSAFTLLEFI
jgi:hypothetical protein